MTARRRPQDAATLRDYLRIATRHKWIVLLVALLVPAVAVLLSLRQQPLYQASAEVLLGRQNLAAMLTGTQDPAAFQQADRVAQTQADLARVPAVASRTLEAAGVTDRTPADFLAASSVTPASASDILVFRVTDPDRTLAVRLASQYAQQFTVFRLELDTSSLERARTEVGDRIAQLEAGGDMESALYASLVDKEQQLSTMVALQTSNAFVIRLADSTERVRPQPLRNGLLGLGLGTLLGLGLAFLWHALDTRVRSTEEIAAQLGLPLLARLPQPPRRLRSKNQLVMLHDPTGIHAEAFRLLRTNIDFVNLERQARTIMVTSAVAAEGKSTTIANLAVALARAGHKVVLVDLDLRRPSLDRLFGLQGRAGVTDVALGRVDLAAAIAWLSIARPSHGKGANGDGPTARVEGALGILPAGPLPPDVGEFVGARTLAGILEGLRGYADFVLIDAPPLLAVGDGLSLSASVDAVLVVAMLKVLRRGMLVELARLLAASPAAALGFVVTDAASEEGYGGSYGYGAYTYAAELDPVA